jgi:hypothetical protein
MAGDSVLSDKLLKQRSWKLDVLPRGTANYDVPCRPAIIVQILIRRDAEVKFVSVHGISVLPAKPEPGEKASTLGWHGPPRPPTMQARRLDAVSGSRPRTPSPARYVGRIEANGDRDRDQTRHKPRQSYKMARRRFMAS